MTHQETQVGESGLSVWSGAEESSSCGDRPTGGRSESLPYQVKARRDEAGFTQEDLADRTGLHRTYIGAIKWGERNVSLATLEALAAGLDCDPRDLLV